MGLCGDTWRRPYIGAAATMLSSSSGLSLARSVSAQHTCQAAEGAKNLTQPQYSNAGKKNTDATFLTPFVQSFLYTVQPHPFPKDLISKIAKDPEQVLSNQESRKEISVYEVGFLVCVAIGILYIFSMPIIGFFLACCRCCGNCGGKMYQKQTSSIHCLRRTLYFSVFAVTIIIFAGNICMFRSNEALKVSVDQSSLELNSSIGDIRTFLTAVPQQVENVSNEGSKTVQEVTRNLDDIGRQVGEKIQQRFKGTLDPASQSVKLLHQESLNSSERSDKSNSSSAQSQSSIDRIQGNVSAVRDRINQTSSKPDCVGCHNLTEDMQKLTLDITISAPSSHEFQAASDEVIKADLQSKISEAEEFFSTIPERVTNETKDLVHESKQKSDAIKIQILQFSQELNLSALNDVSGTSKQVQSDIDEFLPKVKRAEDIRWSVGVALCCSVLSVVASNISGSIIGPSGLSPKVDPTNRTCTSDCGGIFLMMGAGFSFLFSWLFMILVSSLFLSGGNMYTLICRPWNNGQSSKFLDTPDLIPGSELGPSLGLKTKINLSVIYRDCEKDQPLWTTLHLYELVDLGDLLNVSKYTAQIQEEFENNNITSSSVEISSSDLIKQLANISDKATRFNSTAVTQQMNAISSINLNTTADKIDSVSMKQPPDIKNELQNEAAKSRQIQADIETNIFPQVKNSNSSIKSLQSTTEKTIATVGEVSSKVGEAQDFLNTNTTRIVKTESRRFLDCQVEYFTAYAAWANIMITQQVGRCGPVARAVDSAEAVLCLNMVEPSNAFWFSSGWCMMFFIPSIIFSIKLAKYYRRMKYSDVFDNHIIMNHIPRAQMKLT